MEDNSILEPVKEFPNLLKTNTTNAETYFEDLVKKSGINQDENIKTVDKYKATMVKYNAAHSKATKLKVGRVFLWILFGVLVAMGVIFILIPIGNPAASKALFISLGVVFIALAVGDIVLIIKVINPKIKKRDEIAAAIKLTADQLLALANEQMAPLNSIFDWNMPSDVIKKTTPLIQLDKNFDVKKYYFMRDKYGLDFDVGDKSSVYYVQSGSIVGNPFLVERIFDQVDGEKVYTGTLVISWVTYSTDSKGHRYSNTHIQTLTANVKKFCPYYHYRTYLIYSNDSAPDLCFTRTPQVGIEESDKKIAKTVRKDAKKIDKLAEKAVSDSDPSTNFTAMGNDEFDSLFHALDRNNEVQFRLLFTPLAQKNEISLIKSKAPYGDDFNFSKNKKINVIQTRHGQNADIYCNPNNYLDYDVRESKKKFVNYTNSFFQYLYFDLAPILSIPLYQQEKPMEYIYNKGYESNVSFLEQEVMANSFPSELLQPKDAITNSILKTNFIKKDGDFDQVKIKASAFKGYNRTDFIPVPGGDGRIHSVPVHWVEYVPVESSTLMDVENSDSSRPIFNSMMKNQGFANFINRVSKGNTASYQRGLFAFLLSAPVILSSADMAQVSGLVKPKEGGNTNSKQLVRVVELTKKVLNNISSTKRRLKTWLMNQMKSTAQ